MGGGVVMRLSGQDSPATNRAFSTQVFCFHTLAHSFALFCTPLKRNPFLFNPFRTLRQKTRGWGYPWGYPRSSRNSTFLLTPDRLQDRFYFRDIHLDGNRTKDQFERKNHAKHALPAHQDSLYALKRSSQNSYPSANGQKWVRLGAHLPAQPGAQCFELLVGERYRQATKAHQLRYPWHLEYPKPVVQREMDKHISRKERHLQPHIAIFPSTHRAIPPPE